MKPPFRDGPSPLESAIAAVDIPMAWRALGLPGEPDKSCVSPFRAERHPSFSIYADGRMAKDHGTGETFDVVDFVAAALNADKAEGARWLIQYAGTGRTPAAHTPRKAPTRPHKEPERARPPLTLPNLDRGTYADLLALQRARHLPFNAGIQMLIDRGLVRFATDRGNRLWFAVEPGKNAQKRNLDRAAFDLGGRTVKALTLPNACASWPIGTEDARTRETVLLCEGGPDLLAAATVAFWEADGQTDGIGFAAMLGASQGIAEAALASFAGKRVRIFAHADTAGLKAAGRWAKQLRAAGATVDAWRSDLEGEDLNDWTARTWAAPDENGGWPEPILPDNKNAPTARTTGAKA